MPRRQWTGQGHCLQGECVGCFRYGHLASLPLGNGFWAETWRMRKNQSLMFQAEETARWRAMRWKHTSGIATDGETEGNGAGA